MDKVWVIEDPDKYLKSSRMPLIREEVLPSIEKDPALAYTLSLVFWGVGQLYNGQRTKGFDNVCLALLGNLLAILLFMYRRDLPYYLRFFGISPAQAVLAAALLLFLVLIFWVFNASDAYHSALKARQTTFTGIKSRVWPLFCSLVVPGWGQFLNGQPHKGGLFAVSSAFGVFSLISALGILRAWPFLENSSSRFIVEEVLLLSLFSLAAMPFISIISAFDAWKVGREDLKKEPLLERLNAANNRRRAYGWVRGVFPGIKRTFLLTLILVILIVIARFSFPWQFYRECLLQARQWSLQRDMTLIPGFIHGIISLLPLK